MADRVRMVDDEVVIDGVRWRYSISDNDDAPVWALNVHGFFAGGGVYWRESTRLAGGLGWRVVNPSLPGFGGSDPMPWDRVNLVSFAEGLRALLDHLGAPAAVVLGHSMGGAMAIQLAHDHPDRVLGVIYRDGVATNTWKHRHGYVARVLRPFVPDVGDAVEIVTALMADVPDLAWSRIMSMARTAAPDIRQNARSLQGTLPVGAMLLACDFTPITTEVARRGDVPIYPVWGRFDRAIPAETAREFGELVGEKVQWVLGGHSWMVPRPGIQLELLRRSLRGQRFLARAKRRAGLLGLAAA